MCFCVFSSKDKMRILFWAKTFQSNYDREALGPTTLVTVLIKCYYY